MLGCPNMPVAPLTDSDGGAEAASRVGTDGIGVLFTAQLGCGAAVAPLSGAPLTPALPRAHWHPRVVSHASTTRQSGQSSQTNGGTVIQVSLLQSWQRPASIYDLQFDMGLSSTPRIEVPHHQT